MWKILIWLVKWKYPFLALDSRRLAQYQVTKKWVTYGENKYRPEGEAIYHYKLKYVYDRRRQLHLDSVVDYKWEIDDYVNLYTINHNLEMHNVH